MARAMTGTTWLTNLGQVPPDWLDGTAPTEMWFSPPPFNIALGIGAVSVGDNLFLGLRYARTSLSAGAAAEFAEVLRTEVDALSAG